MFLTVFQGAGLDENIRAFAPNAIRIVTVTVAFTIFIGIVNLIWVHIFRVFRLTRVAIPNPLDRVVTSFYSFLLVLVTLSVIVVTVLERRGELLAPAGEPSYSSLLRNTVQYSVEASLAGLLAFSLIYGAYRLMRNRVNFESTIFLTALVLNLLAQAGVLLPNTFENIRLSVIDAGSEGILLGIALATVVAAVRVLIGQDRSFRND